MTEPAAQFTITLAQLNPTVGDVTGNAAKARAARVKATADGADLVVLSELFIAGYPPEDLVLKPAFQSACRARDRGTGAGNRRWRPGDADRHALGRGRQALQCLRPARRRPGRRACASRPICRTTACSMKSALFARGPAAGPVTIRGVRVGVPICEDIWLEESERIRKRGRMPRRDRRGNPDRAERLALCARQERFAAVDRGGAGHRKRAAADLSQRSRRPGRTGVRRRLVRAQRRSVGRGATAGVRGKHHHLALEPNRLPAGAATGRWRRCWKATRATTPPACWACATMSARTDFPACCSASPAASTRRCARRSRSMRSAPSGCAA